MDAGWNQRDNADAKNIPWSYFTFCNPPYDQTVLFWIKGAIEYHKGNNVAFIVQRWSAKGKFFESLIDPIAMSLKEEFS